MLAVVDIGSNSIKYLVAKMHRGAIVPLAQDSQVTGLGRGLAHHGSLEEEPINLSILALERFQEKISKDYPQARFVVLGTAAVRDAKNSQSIKDAVQRIFGQELRVLNGNEEARMSMEGASTARTADMPLDEILFLDIGGASTEFGYLKPNYFAYSTKLGAVRTHQMVGFSKDAIDDEHWMQAGLFIENEILNVFSPEQIHLFSERKHLIAVGGTLVMAAKSINAQALGEDTYQVNIKNYFEKIEGLRKMSETQRLKNPSIVKGRADILPCGMLILKKAIDLFQIENLVVTSRGIRHGFILENEKNEE